MTYCRDKRPARLGDAGVPRLLYGDYPDSAVTDPTGSDKGINRVHRGGSFDAPARVCRSAYRGMNAPDYGYEDVGFRLALVPVQ